MLMSDKTTARNLESRFESGEDVLDYFDLSKASRPLLKKERINLDIPHWMILRIDQVANRKGMAGNRRSSNGWRRSSKKSRSRLKRRFRPAGRVNAGSGW